MSANPFPSPLVVQDPWTDSLNVYPLGYEVSPGGITYCPVTVSTAGGTSEEQRSQAEYVASAVNCHGDLLEALRVCVAALSPARNDEEREAVAVARAAILKAEGRTE